MYIYLKNEIFTSKRVIFRFLSNLRRLEEETEI